MVVEQGRGERVPGVVEAGVLVERLAEALSDRADDLPLDEEGVDDDPDVVDGDEAPQPDRPGLARDLDDGAVAAEGERLGRGEPPLGVERPGLPADLGEREGLAARPDEAVGLAPELPSGHAEQLPGELLGGGHEVEGGEVGGRAADLDRAAAEGPRALEHLSGVAEDDAHLGRVEAGRLGDDLGEGDEVPLSLGGGADPGDELALGREAHLGVLAGAGLAARALEPAGDPEADEHLAALLLAALLLGADRLDVERGEGGVEGRRVPPAVVDGAGRRGVGEGVVGEEVAPAQLHRVDPEPAGGGVDEPLERVGRLRAPGAAVGGGRGRVRHDGPDPHVQRRDPVRPGHVPGRQLGDERPGVRVGADVGQDLRLEREEPALAVEAEPEPRALAPAVRARAERLAAVLDPAHGPPEVERCRGDREVLGVGLALRAERTADEGDAHLHRLLRERERGGEVGAQAMGRLVGAKDAKPALDRLGEDRPRLERGRGDPLVVDGQLDDEGAAGEHRLAGLAELSLGDEVGDALEQRRGGRVEGRCRVDHGLERLEVDLDQRGGVLGEVAVVGDDEGDGVADVADPPLAQRPPPHRLRHRCPRGRRHVADGREVRGGVGPSDARRRARRVEADAEQPPVRRPAAHEGRVAATWPLDVADEAGLAPQQREVLGPQQGRPDVPEPRPARRAGHGGREYSAPE